MTVDRDRYRALAAAFATGVAVITARDADGAPKGLTTQSFIGLSTEPPLVLVSIDRTARTLPALQHTGAFVVNFLRAGAEDVSTKFASKDDDKFSVVAWRPSEAAHGAPILHDVSAAYAECVVERSLEAGDHWIFIGRVEGGEVLGGTPLLYYRRMYAAWPEERPAPAMG